MHRWLRLRSECNWFLCKSFVTKLYNSKVGGIEQNAKPSCRRDCNRQDSKSESCELADH